ncbi:MAG: SPOR domain-containing protein [Daejeonella sp.]
MNIALYISELLQQQVEVNVPGFGTFFKVRIAGFFDEQNQTFIPPAQQLVFEQNSAKNTDLSEHISVKKNISSESADYFIENYVSALHNLLENTNEAELNPLGTLKKTNDEYVFQVAGNLDLGSSYFGLKPVSELSQKEFIKEEKDVIIDQPLTKNQEEEISYNNVHDDEVSEMEETESSGMAFKYKMLITIAILLSIAGGIYLYNPKIYDSILEQDFIQNAKQFFNSKTSQQAIVLTDSIAKNDTLDSKGINAEKVQDTLKTDTQKTPVYNENVIYFEIIGAAFKNKQEAEDYIKSLKLRGIEAKIVDKMPGPKVKVSLGTFTDAESAQKELVRIQKEINNEAWIARVKPL